MMGMRPRSLEPGNVLTPLVVRQGATAASLGSSGPGRFQMLMFERGHWCSSCRRRLALIMESFDEFVRRRIDVVAVTHEAADVLRDRVYPFAVIADPELEIAARFEVEGVDEFGARTIRPSTILVRDTGEIAFSYVGDDSRDRPTIPALLLALDNLR